MDKFCYSDKAERVRVLIVSFSIVQLRAAFLKLDTSNEIKAFGIISKYAYAIQGVKCVAFRRNILTGNGLTEEMFVPSVYKQFLTPFICRTRCFDEFDSVVTRCLVQSWRNRCLTFELWIYQIVCQTIHDGKYSQGLAMARNSQVTDRGDVNVFLLVEFGCHQHMGVNDPLRALQQRWFSHRCAVYFVVTRFSAR